VVEGRTERKVGVRGRGGEQSVTTGQPEVSSVRSRSASDQRRGLSTLVFFVSRELRDFFPRLIDIDDSTHTNDQAEEHKYEIVEIVGGRGSERKRNEASSITYDLTLCAAKVRQRALLTSVRYQLAGDTFPKCSDVTQRGGDKQSCAVPLRGIMSERDRRR